MTRWLQRATTGNLQDEKIGYYYKRLGHKPGMKPLQMAKLVHDDLDKLEAQAKAQGKPFSAQEYLPAQGFANQEDKKVLVSHHAVLRNGDLTMMKDVADAPDDAAPIREAIDKSEMDPLVMKRRADVKSDLGQFNVDSSHLAAEAMRETVFNSGKNRPGSKLQGEYKDVADDLTLRKPIYMQRSLDDAFQQLDKKNGIEVPSLGLYNPVGSHLDADKKVQANIKLFTEKGINPQKKILAAQSALTDQKLAADVRAEDEAGNAIAKREADIRQQKVQAGAAQVNAKPVQAVGKVKAAKNNQVQAQGNSGLQTLQGSRVMSSQESGLLPMPGVVTSGRADLMTLT